MIYFIAGIAVGAAFAPFWIKVWNFAKDKIQQLIKKEIK